MRAPIAVESVLLCPAEVVFEAALQPATFAYVTLGMLDMPSLYGREQPFQAGEIVAGRLYLGNLIPMWAHEIEVVEIDPDGRRLVMHETGGLVHLWHHTTDVESLGAERCRLRDTAQIEAAAPPGVMVELARTTYRHRHRRWERLVASWGFPAARGARPVSAHS